MLIIPVFLLAQSYEQAQKLFENGQYKDAAQQFDKFCNMYEKNGSGSDTLLYPSALVYRARCYDLMNQYKKAEDAYQIAKIYFEENDIIYNENYALILNNLALINENIGNYQNADFLYGQALLIRKKVMGENHSQTIETMLNIANFYKNNGRYVESEKYFNEVLAATVNVHGSESIEYALALHGFASMYIALGNGSKAEQMLTRAAEISFSDTTSNNDVYLMIENDLGVIYFNRSEFEKAEDAFTMVCSVKKLQPNFRDADYATYLQNLASVKIVLGNYENAKVLIDEALSLITQVYGNRSLNYASVLYTSAALSREMRDYKAAEAALKETSKILRKSSGSKSLFYAKSMSGLATVYYDMSKIAQNEEEKKSLLSQSESIYADVLSIYESSLGITSLSYISTLSSIATVFQQQHDFVKTEEYLTKAIELLQSTGNDKTNEAFIPFSNLAALYYEEGKTEKCDKAFTDCNALFNILLENNFRFLSEREKLLYIESVRYNIEVYKSFLLKRYESNPEAGCNFYNLELRTKGMVLNSGIEIRKSIVNMGDSLLLATYDQWLTLRSELAMQLSLPESQRMPGWDSIENLADNFEKQWVKGCPYDLALAKTEWKSVQQTLQPDEATIEFSRFQYCSPKGWSDSVVYVALIIRSDVTYPVVVYLCKEADVDSLVMSQGNTDAGFASRLYRGMVLPNLGNEKNDVKILYELLWEPMEKYLEGVEKIYYSPSGLLHQISFAAIPVTDSILLSDKYILIRVSSTSVLSDSLQRGFSNPHSILAFGGISYDTDAETQLAVASKYYDENYPSGDNTYALSEAETASRGGNWEYLPGTLNEVQGIHLLARKYNLISTPVTGNEAVEEVIKNISAVGTPDIIHIATHGFFFPNQGNSDLQQFFTTGEKQQAFRKSQNPLQRAGLLFAGANSSWKGRKMPPPVDDGILTAYEISNLYLPKTRLVVLSACETGVGDIKGDEGVFGLQRAFKTAGVDYIVMSLWKVPDFETSEFMQLFYAKLFGGLPIEEAFTQAQNAMRDKYRSEPYKWAAFVLLH